MPIGAARRPADLIGWEGKIGKADGRADRGDMRWQAADANVIPASANPVRGLLVRSCRSARIRPCGAAGRLAMFAV
jgi:hypothetical protein